MRTERNEARAIVRTIHQEMNPLAALYHWLFDGKFLLRHYSDSKDCALVLDADGNVIGGAHTMRAGGWAVHTKPFSGHVSSAQVVFVDGE